MNKNIILEEHLNTKEDEPKYKKETKSTKTTTTTKAKKIPNVAVDSHASLQKFGSTRYIRAILTNLTGVYAYWRVYLTRNCVLISLGIELLNSLLT